MPPFRRRNYYYRNYWNSRWRRNRFRRRRTRKTFQGKRRRRRVRKRYFKTNFKKKLKKITLREWQPSHIKKCHIKGYLLLFEAGHGRFANNFTPYKESYTPPRQPGGGGWGIQQLSLGNLFVQNSYFMNWWTQTNKSLNMCRYFGARLKLFRQQETDWIFTYFTEKPTNADKFWYPSFHPMRLILDKHKVVVPSIKTQPLKRKIYKSIFVKPPKMFKTNWYFQQQISNYSLIYFAAVACSLNDMFLSPKATNNNTTVITLNTSFFQRSAFQYTSTTYGYQPKEGVFVYGLRNGEFDIKNEPKNKVIYLGETHVNDPGIPVGVTGWAQYQSKNKWGNIFYHEYLNLQRTVFLAKKPDDFLQNTQQGQKIGTDTVTKSEPLITYLRYNPYKDKGDGNMAYWKSVSDATNNNWDPPKNPNLIIQGYPFWLMLWGWEDHTRKLSEIRDLDNNYMLVLKSKYFDTPYPAYVPLSESFVNGRAPYDNEIEDISPTDMRNWFPKWQFQKEAIDNILMTGPGVCKAPNSQSIQAFMRYDFSFKWGGEPATMENISDPNSQPITPTPDQLFLQNEIISPETNLKNFIYKWDTRRDILTQSAIQRISEIATDDYSLFTDGTTTSTDIPQEKTSQKKTTQEEEEQTLLLQLNNLQQLNEQLQLRFQQLKQLTKDK
nr:MAG: ORF1 [TTV-like mini virus]